jgi:hypothetical protein
VSIINSLIQPTLQCPNFDTTVCAKPQTGKVAISPLLDNEQLRKSLELKGF